MKTLNGIGVKRGIRLGLLPFEYTLELSVQQCYLGVSESFVVLSSSYSKPSLRQWVKRGIRLGLLPFEYSLDLSC